MLCSRQNAALVRVEYVPVLGIQCAHICELHAPVTAADCRYIQHKNKGKNTVSEGLKSLAAVYFLPIVLMEPLSLANEATLPN